MEFASSNELKMPREKNQIGKSFWFWGRKWLKIDRMKVVKLQFILMDNFSRPLELQHNAADCFIRRLNPFTVSFLWGALPQAWYFHASSAVLCGIVSRRKSLSERVIWGVEHLTTAKNENTKCQIYKNKDRMKALLNETWEYLLKTLHAWSSVDFPIRFLYSSLHSSENPLNFVGSCCFIAAWQISFLLQQMHQFLSSDQLSGHVREHTDRNVWRFIDSTETNFSYARKNTDRDTVPKFLSARQCSLQVSHCDRQLSRYHQSLILVNVTTKCIGTKW